MSDMNKTEYVRKQYSDAKNLSIRIKLHANHSTNKTGISSWLFEQYQFAENYRILELGCGNGSQWEGRIDSLPEASTLVLSDFSEGMVECVKKQYHMHEHVSFERIDIQEIHYPDETFDMIIANYMLYHIPDLPKALSEVKRVLKTGGKFYCATNGNGGMAPYLHHALKQFDPATNAFMPEWTFSLQNGAALLEQYFVDVKRCDYIDSLSITNTQDLVDWIQSTISMTASMEYPIDRLYDYFETIRIRDGAINIPKESGLFISVK